MLRTVLLVCVWVSFCLCQIGGRSGPCSAVAIPGPFYQPVTVYSSTLASSTLSNSSYCSNAPPQYTGAIWYTLEAQNGAILTVTTCSSYTDFDTVLTVYPAGSCSNLYCSAVNDDACGEGSTVTFESTYSKYFISVAGHDYQEGKFELVISAIPPKNATTYGCDNAIAVPGPYFKPVTIVGDTEFSVPENRNNSCGLANGSKVDWYLIYPAYGSYLDITTCSETTNFDTKLALFTGSCSSLYCWTSNDDAFCGVSNRSYTSDLYLYASSSYYYLAVFGYNNAAGTYKLRISQESGNSTTARNCKDAIPVPFVPGQLMRFNGTTENSEVSLVSACGKPHRAPSTWYKIEIPSNYAHPITASTCYPGTKFDTMLSVYSGSSCDELLCSGHNDDNCSHASTVTWTLPRKTLSSPDVETSVRLTYYIQVSGFVTDSGAFELSVQ